MKKEYQPFGRSALQILIKEPGEISDKPYMLYAAYALSNLYDMVAPDEDEDCLFTPDNMWGCKIDKKTLDRWIIYVAEDFNDAASNRNPIRIWGKNYTIRKVCAYDRSRLPFIFNFPLENGEYTIAPDGVMNLTEEANESVKCYEVSKEHAKENRIYLRKIITLAEDDAHDGWDKLTDMEIVVYCWALFYNKYQNDNFLQFEKEYKDYIYVSERDILDCLNEKSTLRQSPVGMYAFSYKKIQDWNKSHNQDSIADKINEEEAENYWYDVALKNTFKPIDQR